MDKRLFLIGHPLGHSWSPALHAELGSKDYALMELEPDRLEGWIKGDSWDGANVTIPYKQAVIPYCDELSDDARRIGSVNTLLRRPDGTIYGDNTDIFGFTAMAARAGISFKDKKVLVLGSGGTSHTACDAIRTSGGLPVVISRKGENTYDNIADHADADIIVNTTPVGMWPHISEQPVDLTVFRHLSGVLDVVYNPSRTRLVRQAEKLRIPCAGGLFMLCGQAAKAHEIWTGEKADPAVIEHMHDAVLAHHRSIVFIGMPGSGKSTIGRFTAREIGLPFVDADTEIVRRIGTDIPSYFRQHGEAAFRDIESEVIRDLMLRGGHVIATGGGAILREENRDMICGFGRVIRLRRPIEDLPVSGRPVSQAKGIQALAQEREPFYAACADITIENAGTPGETMDAVLRALSK